MRMTTTTDMDSDSSIPRNRSSPKAIVILLGWLGAKFGHLSKYAELYEERGCTTISTILDPRSIMTGDLDKIDELLTAVVKEAVKHLRQQHSATTTDDKGQEEDRAIEIPVICHVFSNGGAFPLQRLERTLDRRQAGEVSDNMDEDWKLFGRSLAKGGEIFDSSPAYLDWDTLCGAILAALPNNIILAYFLVSISFLFIQIRALVSFLKGQDNYTKKYWDHYVNSRFYTSIVAYIYSRADTITNSTKLDELVAARRRKRRAAMVSRSGTSSTSTTTPTVDSTATDDGMSSSTTIHQQPPTPPQILAQRFEDSSHVQHLRLHRAKYIDVIEQVLKAISSAA
jgi:hypothetical protein